MTAAAVLALLHEFKPNGDGEALKSAELIGMLLQHSAAPFSRNQFEPGHITATACVLHPHQKAVLLIHHKRLDRWLLPGGHVEAEDSSPSCTASREATEETGVVLKPRDPLLVGMDVHGIPPKKQEPYHLHHDLIYYFAAESETVEVTSETLGVVWCPFAEFDQYGLAGSIQRSARRAWEASALHSQ